METKTKYLITGLLIGLAIMSYGAVLMNEEAKKERCFDEALELWNSVNVNYPINMNNQESYDKNSRQTCASFYYISCINGVNVNCAKTEAEKLSDVLSELDE